MILHELELLDVNLMMGIWGPINLTSSWTPQDHIGFVSCWWCFQEWLLNPLAEQNEIRIGLCLFQVEERRWMLFQECIYFIIVGYSKKTSKSNVWHHLTLILAMEHSWATFFFASRSCWPLHGCADGLKNLRTLNYENWRHFFQLDLYLFDWWFNIPTWRTSYF